MGMIGKSLMSAGIKRLAGILIKIKCVVAAAIRADQMRQGCPGMIVCLQIIDLSIARIRKGFAKT